MDKLDHRARSLGSGILAIFCRLRPALVKIELADGAAGCLTRWLCGLLAGPTGWRAVLVASRSSRQDPGRVASACCRDVEVVAWLRTARPCARLDVAQPERHGLSGWATFGPGQGFTRIVKIAFGLIYKSE